MKQISKERIGSKVMERYDKAKTPYQRILEFPDINDAIKEKLKRKYNQLNPAELHRQIVKLQNKLIKLVII